jgi:hypothetical protein
MTSRAAHRRLALVASIAVAAACGAATPASASTFYSGGLARTARIGEALAFGQRAERSTYA